MQKLLAKGLRLFLDPVYTIILIKFFVSNLLKQSTDSFFVSNELKAQQRGLLSPNFGFNLIYF